VEPVQFRTVCRKADGSVTVALQHLKILVRLFPQEHRVCAVYERCSSTRNRLVVGSNPTLGRKAKVAQMVRAAKAHFSICSRRPYEMALKIDDGVDAFSRVDLRHSQMAKC
jgi:hypothetical protein